MREQKELYQEHKDVAQERNDLPSKEQVDKLAKMASDKDDRRKIRNSYKKDSKDINQRYEQNVDKAKEFYRDNENALNDTARVEMEQELGIDKEEKESKRETISKTNLKSKATNLLMGAGVFLAGAGVLAWGYGNMKGTVNESAKANSNVDPEPDANEEITVNETPEEIGDEIEINSPGKENTNIKTEIEESENRSWDFSQTTLEWNHEAAEGKETNLNVYSSPGLLTITRPETAKDEDIEGEEIVIRKFPRDEQIIHEWDVLPSITENHVVQNFWIKGTTAHLAEVDNDGNVKVLNGDYREQIRIDYLDQEGKPFHTLRGKLVEVDGSLLFYDFETGEIKPPSFENAHVLREQGEWVGVNYPQEAVEITIQAHTLVKPGTSIQYHQGPAYSRTGESPYIDYGWSLPTKK